METSSCYGSETGDFCTKCSGQNLGCLDCSTAESLERESVIGERLDHAQERMICAALELLNLVAALDSLANVLESARLNDVASRVNAIARRLEP